MMATSQKGAALIADNEDNPLTPTEFLEWIRHRWDTPRDKSKDADWVMVWLTVAIAIAAFWSACIFQSQLSEMHRATILDQRAWVGLAEPKIDEFNEDKYPRVSFRFVNSGKTPAIHVQTQIDWMPSIRMGPVCEERGRSKQFYKGPAIPPQGPYILHDPTNDPWYVENTGDQKQHWGKASLSASFFCFFGEISYTDIFTAVEHTTHFCIYGYPGKPNETLYCKEGNDMN
jgi:hypothetical protein